MDVMQTIDSVVSSFESGNPKAAFDQLELALKEHSDHRLHLVAANLLNATNDIPKAFRHAKLAVSTAPEGAPFPEGHHTLGILFAKSGLFEQAELHLRHADYHLPGTHDIQYALGSVLAVSQKLKDAQQYFDSGAKILCGDGSHTSSSILRIDDALAFQSGNAQLPMRRLSIFGHTQKHPEVDNWIFVCADNNYINRFLQEVTASVERFGNGKLGIHIHIINPEADCFDLVDKCVSEGVPLSLSHESTDLGSMTRKQQITYYSTARFLMLSQLLDKLDAPIIMMDIDQVIISDLEPFLSSVSDKCVSLLRFPEIPHNILSYISATLAYVRPSLEGKLFARILEDKTLRSLSSLENYQWHLDQALLVSTYLCMEDNIVGDIRKEFICLSGLKDKTPHSTFLSVTASLNHGVASDVLVEFDEIF